MPPLLIKTEMCRSWETNGACKYGDRCTFAHGVEDMREAVRDEKYKTKPCRTFTSCGACPYGPRCNFVHIAMPFERRRLSVFNNIASAHSCSKRI